MEISINVENLWWLIVESLHVFFWKFIYLAIGSACWACFDFFGNSFAFVCFYYDRNCVSRLLFAGMFYFHFIIPRCILLILQHKHACVFYVCNWTITEHVLVCGKHGVYNLLPFFNHKKAVACLSFLREFRMNDLRVFDRIPILWWPEAIHAKRIADYLIMNFIWLFDYEFYNKKIQSTFFYFSNRKLFNSNKL